MGEKSKVIAVVSFVDGWIYFRLLILLKCSKVEQKKNTIKREEEGLCGGPMGRIDGLACTGNENVGMQKNYFWDKIYEVFNKNDFSWVFLWMLEKQRLKIKRL